jgi:hypothetical protein
LNTSLAEHPFLLSVMELTSAAFHFQRVQPCAQGNPLMCLVRFTTYLTHVISNPNSFTPLVSESGHGTRRNHCTRDAVQKGPAPFAGETKCGAFGPGLASADRTRNPGRFAVSHPINLHFRDGLRHPIHFLLSHQCSSFVCQDFKLALSSHIRVLGITH